MSNTPRLTDTWLYTLVTFHFISVIIRIANAKRQMLVEQNCRGLPPDGIEPSVVRFFQSTAPIHSQSVEDRGCPSSSSVIETADIFYSCNRSVSLKWKVTRWVATRRGKETDFVQLWSPTWNWISVFRPGRDWIVQYFKSWWRYINRKVLPLQHSSNASINRKYFLSYFIHTLTWQSTGIIAVIN